MTLIGLLLILIVLGVIVYLVETYIPMSPPFKVVLRVVVVVVACLLLLEALGFDVPIASGLRR